MVSALIGLAHNFGMRVIVEGVEKPEQLELLRKLGGDEVQGFLLGHPLPDPVAHLDTLLNGYHPMERELETSSVESSLL